MKLLKRLVQIVAIFAFPVLSQDDEAADTMRNVELGMAGLKEATKNPALLAQLMQDLQVRKGCVLSRSSL